MERRVSSALAAAAVLAAVPAQAADYAMPGVADVQGWKVIRTANSCGMNRLYPAAESSAAPHTSLMILAEHGRYSTHVVLTNAAWPTEADKRYLLRYDLGDFSYRMPATGLRAEGVAGFETDVSDNFLYDISRAEDLTISRDGTVLGKMSLRGGYAAVVEFRECVAAMRAEQRR
ncbi:MAG: hypothetical protein QM676_10670 [Novosphingobium sp.]